MGEVTGLSKNDMEKIISILNEQPGVNEALIFGSRAKGNFKNGSDIDIALKGSLTFEMVAHLGFLLNEETNMPYRFDVLNYQTIHNPELLNHINRVGIIIYKRQ